MGSTVDDDVRINVIIFGHFDLSCGAPGPLNPPPIQLLLHLFYFWSVPSVLVDVDRPALQECLDLAGQMTSYVEDDRALVRPFLEEHAFAVVSGLHSGAQQLLNLVPADALVSSTCSSFMYCHGSVLPLQTRFRAPSGQIADRSARGSPVVGAALGPSWLNRSRPRPRTRSQPRAVSRLSLLFRQVITLPAALVCL